MKAILTFLIFLLSGVVALALLGAGMVYLASTGSLPDSAAGHYIMSVCYFMMFCSLALSVLGTISGAVLGIAGFLLGSRLRTLISFALGILSGVLWYYLLNCKV